jgi:hypothetical protein
MNLNLLLIMKSQEQMDENEQYHPMMKQKFMIHYLILLLLLQLNQHFPNVRDDDLLIQMKIQHSHGLFVVLKKLKFVSVLI